MVETTPIPHQCPNCSATLDVSEQEPFSEIHCPRCNTPMRVRSQFDYFQLVEVIASGGMGTVYKARDTNLNRIVALKLLRKEFSADLDYIEKLETEAKITASVNHPCVVQVFSFGSDHDQYYIAMELVDKGSLDDLMNLQGRIAEVQVLEIGTQVAMGLRAAFQAGLIHRDVKPGNILFADAHSAKIVDFGLAIPLERAEAETGGEIWGTPYYIAPEKLNHEPEDFRSDIYSLGGTLFHALAGRPPFEAENASMVALKHLKSQAVSLQAFAPNISGPTAYVINRMLAKNPDERYQSYDELIEHFEYARSQLLEEKGKVTQRVVVEGAEQQSAQGYVILAFILIALLLGVGFFIFKDSLLPRRLSVEELEQRRIEKGMNSAEQTLAKARKQLIDGDAPSAYAALKELEERPELGQPLKSWVIVTEGIAAYTSNLPSDGRSAFGRLHTNGLYSFKKEDATLAKFFVDLGTSITDKKTVTSAISKDANPPDFQPIALLAYGLKAWNASQFKPAVSLFRDFVSATPQGAYGWIADFKPLAKRYLDDFNAYSDFAVKLKAATTASDKTALVTQADALKAKLRLPGKLVDRLTADQRLLQSASSSETPPWVSTDIGDVGLPGRTKNDSGIYSLAGAGVNIWAEGDGFRFHSRQLTGDGSIVARVVSANDTGSRSKAGVMMRANLEPGSRHVSIFLQPTRGAEEISRVSKGSKSTSVEASPFQAPCWLKLVRSGDTFEAFASKDGSTWTPVGKSIKIPMNETIQVGLAVVSLNKKHLKTATFDSVIIR